MPSVCQKVSSGIPRVAVGSAWVWSIAILLWVVGCRVQMWRWRHVGMGGCHSPTTTGTRGEEKTTPML